MAHFILSLAFQALIFLLLILLAAFLAYCIYIKHIHIKYDHIPGPPRDSFFFGNSPTIMHIMKNGLVHDKYLEWAEVFGSVYKFSFLHYVFIVVTSPEATKTILLSPKYPKDNFVYKTLFSVFGQRFLGNGLITVQDHEYWYKQRRIIEPTFNTLYLKGVMGTLNDRAEKLMDKLSEVSDNRTEANMVHLFHCVTMDVIAKFNPKNRPFVKEVRDSCRLLRASGAQWIKERRAAMQNGDDVPKDILTQMIKVVGKEESVTPEDEECIVDNFMTFITAGQETTGNLLASCLMEMARQPEILQKVRKELDDVIGMKQDISYDNLGQLVYLSQVLKETLRLYPPAPSTSRDLQEDVVMDGIHVHAGVICMFNTYVTGRMERFFKDPLTFDPDRFHPNAPKPYYCYYPFSLGPRSCMGQNFAQMEAKVVMAKLFQRFDFTLLPGQTRELMDTGPLKPKSGVMCYVTHRDHNK
ncbi:cholesterol 24-hydroxylase-like isoform X2 [Antennarius striatus]|uniref:cholesterol 24-hydroxylase-like isoform X2 n=1 Tax=Antennarius striatus TaxID=241820 RepID=UPI0035AF1322